MAKSGPEHEVIAPESQSQTYQQIVMARIRAITDNLKDDEELQVLCGPINDRITAGRLHFTEGTVVIVEGKNEHSERAYFFSTTFALEMICKVVKLRPKAKRKTIGFVPSRK